MESSINGRGLIFINESEMLVIRYLALYVINLETGEKRYIGDLPVSKSKQILSRNRVLSRLLRLEPKCIGSLSKGNYVFCLFSKLWCVNVITKSIKEICNLRRGFSVLNFCKHENVLFFGDYGINKDYEAINVYKLDSQLNLSTVFTFNSGEIRHIHNIIDDTVHQRLIILAGDNEKRAGIYFSDYDFKNLTPFVIGQQKYRSVIAFPREDGILYATDSVETQNTINLLSYDGTIKKSIEINGSCIYGTETPDYYVFSTTVEPKEGSSIKDFFLEKLGGGIKSREVNVILVSKKSLSVKILGMFRKDKLPMKLFQYGRMIFPSQQINKNALWMYNIGCKKIDGKTFKIDIT